MSACNCSIWICIFFYASSKVLVGLLLGWLILLCATCKGLLVVSRKGLRCMVAPICRRSFEVADLPAVHECFGGIHIYLYTCVHRYVRTPSVVSSSLSAIKAGYQISATTDSARLASTASLAFFSLHSSCEFGCSRGISRDYSWHRLIGSSTSCSQSCLYGPSRVARLLTPSPAESHIVRSLPLGLHCSRLQYVLSPHKICLSS